MTSFDSVVAEFCGEWEELFATNPLGAAGIVEEANDRCQVALGKQPSNNEHFGLDEQNEFA